MIIAVMIPMDNAAMAEGTIWPLHWNSDGGGVFGIEFPELDHGIPRLDGEVAEYVQEEAEGFMAIGHGRMFIETRSEAVLNRVRLMAIERDDVQAEVYLVRGNVEERHEVNRYGAINPWPSGLFEHTAREADAILRKAMSKRKNANKVA